MNKQTLSKEERQEQELRERHLARVALEKRAIERKANKEARFFKKIAARTQQLRVIKPKPQRKLKKGVTVAVNSIGGQNVEDENEWENID
jgi:hypothetical protein